MVSACFSATRSTFATATTFTWTQPSGPTWPISSNILERPDTASSTKQRKDGKFQFIFFASFQYSCPIKRCFTLFTKTKKNLFVLWLNKLMSKGSADLYYSCTVLLIKCKKPMFNVHHLRFIPKNLINDLWETNTGRN